MKRQTGLIEYLQRQATGNHRLPNGAQAIRNDDDDLTRLACRYARAFSCTLKEKQFIALCNISVPLAQAISLGAWMAGHPLACINPSFTKIQLEDVLAKLGTCLKIGRPDCLASLENKTDWLSPDLDETGNNNLSGRLQLSANQNPIVPYEWRDDECAVVIFTSGTTGMPKGVCHSLGNLTRSAQLFIEHNAIDSESRLLSLAPHHSVTGFRLSVIVPLLTDCKLIESPKVVNLEEILNTLYDERPTYFLCGSVFSRQLAMLAGKLEDELSSLRILKSTGAKLDRPSRIEIWEKLRIPVLDGYGMTETAGMVISEKRESYNPELASVGKECSGVTVEIAEVDGISDRALGVGQIRVYSPNLFLGYLGEPLERKRYFDTGDLGMRDKAGNIFLKGRMDHGVKATSGFWLFPQAVEQFLVNRPDVADAHVRSEYDPYGRGVLQTRVVPSDPETGEVGWLTALSQDIESQLGPDYKAVNIEIVDEIQRTPLGKVLSSS